VNSAFNLSRHAKPVKQRAHNESAGAPDTDEAKV